MSRVPPDPAPSPITVALRRLEDGDPGAADELLPLVYEELRELARARLADHAQEWTLQATALVHEAWCRLGGRDRVAWSSRAHFFGAAALAMRRILVEQHRRRRSAKRGGGLAHEVIEADVAAPAPADSPDQQIDLLALDVALSQLEQEHPRQAQVVTLRYFGGRSLDEIAELLEVSPRTVDRDWEFARRWLQRELA